jgi:hypothetical protein
MFLPSIEGSFAEYFVITPQGRWQCEVRYTRTREDIVLNGNCDGSPIQMNSRISPAFQDGLLVHPKGPNSQR